MPELIFGTKSAAAAIQAVESVGRSARELKKTYAQTKDVFGQQGDAITKIYAKITAKQNEVKAQIREVEKAQKKGTMSVEDAVAKVKLLQDTYAKMTRAAATKIKSLQDAHSKLAQGGARDINQLKETWSKLHPKVQETKNSAGQFGTFLATKLGPAVAGVMSVHKALALVVSEFKELVALGDKAAASQSTNAEAVDRMIGNMPGTTPETQRRYISAVGAVASETAVPARFAYQGFGVASSASAGNYDAALDAVRVSAMVNRFSPHDIPTYAGPLTAFSNVTQSTDALANQGLLSWTGGRSRIDSPALQAANIPRALAGAVNLGANYREAAALYAAITTTADDRTGESSGTALQQLIGALRTLPGDGTMEERLSRIQGADRTEQLQFLSDLGGEERFRGAFEQLILNPESTIAQNVRSGLADIPSDIAGLRSFGQASLNRSANPFAATRNAEEILESGAAGLRSRQRPALSLAARESLREILQRTGGSGLGSDARILMRQLDGGGIVDLESAIEILESQRDFAATPRPSGGFVASGGVGAPGTAIGTRMVSDPESARALGEMINLLQQQLEEAQETNRALDGVTGAPARMGDAPAGLPVTTD